MSSDLTDTPHIRVVAGALIDDRQRVLVAQRHADAHQGGLWEFPGGKREPGESRPDALRRELSEELGVQVTAGRPLIRLTHQYPDLRVDLDLWRVQAWQGEPRSMEGQALRWVSPQSLDQLDMPAADRPLVRALQLPERYAITAPGRQPAQLRADLDHYLDQGIRLIQLRQPGCSQEQQGPLIESLLARCHAAGARLLLNSALDASVHGLADGLHLTRADLLRAPAELPRRHALLGASCHDLKALRQAARLGCDLAVLSPVFATQSHPGAPTLGSEGFSQWVADAAVPVYALGGMRLDQLEAVFDWGGQGIAGISAFLG